MDKRTLDVIKLKALLKARKARRELEKKFKKVQNGRMDRRRTR
jgi:hypothetical protein